MARLRDIPKVFRTVGPIGFAQRLYTQINDDDLFVWAAALAYAWLFAIFPFLISMFGLLPYLPEQAKEGAIREIGVALFDLLSRDAAQTIWDNVKVVLTRPASGIFSLGLFISFWAASGGMNMTISAMDRVYEFPTCRPFYRQRPLALLLTFVVAALVIVIMALLPAGTVAIMWLERHGQIALISSPLAWAARILRYPVAMLLMFMVLSIIYHFGPRVKQRYRFITPGAVFCVAIWLALGYGLRAYLDILGNASAYRETYGTVGGVAIILIIFYLDALVLLIGAEINSEIDFELLGVPRGSTDFRKPYERPEAGKQQPQADLDVDPAAKSATQQAEP